ncbi:glycosyltransferase family 2 protein [Xylophilus sp. GOD-11R]|uniref:glycosyltransferase family 2 protein n=1 Tax=Xylophilus sp. GOD-11R TaxID=3089814 RepID=UPI00298CA71F|nr:glycosyltransferase family 2 protein [Xylophilus sp. GOD-11R]WPB57091.1 glycosyltransferase family 2 protein [Xylophilus sp. GOD-11R]
MSHDSLRLARDRTQPPAGFGPTPWRSVAIHGAVLAAWAALFAMAFSSGGVLAWSVGVAYVSYDTLLLVFVGTRTWALRGDAVTRPGRPADVASPRATLAVLVAAHNEAAVLPVTLAALLAQDDPPERIVVVDDGSTDGTGALLTGRYGVPATDAGACSEAGTLHPGLRWLRLPHGGKAVALNAALPLVDCDIVLTVDGDTLLEPGAIAAIRRAFAADPALMIATGVITPVCRPTWQGRIFQWFQTYEYLRNFLSRFAWMRMDSLLLVSGAFAAYRRAELMAVGGFDAASLVEDYELTHRMRRHAVLHGLHWHVGVLGDARARTDAPASLGAFLRQRRRWFGGFLQTQFRYREMVGDRRYGWMGTLMLPVKAIDTLQPLFGLTAFGLLVWDVASGRISLLAAAGAVIGIKLAIDLAFHLWSIHLYRRWTGGGQRIDFVQGLLAALAEPFTFQLLRHTGAALGWVMFVTGRGGWGRQHRNAGLGDEPQR